MTIIIIGSEGFIGSHCKEYFLNQQHEVICCDVIEKTEKNYYYVNSLKNDYAILFEGRDVDCCINAAGSANVSYSYQFPEKDFELNVSLVINLLGAIKNHKPSCKFINFSSAAVYGNPYQLPINESGELKPLSPYGYHKMLSEKLLMEYHRFFGLKTCSLRVFSAYGPGLKKQLFWDIYQKAESSKNIKLYGTGNESRDFIYISDLVNALDLVLHNSNFEGEAINIASGIEISIKDAASTFAKCYPETISIEFSGDVKEGDPINWRADIGVLKSMNYNPAVSITKGLEMYINWLINN